MNFRVDLETYFMRPADICFAEKPTLIRTVLGSCVTITMFHKNSGAAAACHPTLPVCRHEDSCRPARCRYKFKYVECVIPEMIKWFLKLGVQPDELEIKLFGGANLFSRHNANGRVIHVGNMNVSMARQKIDELQIKIKSFDVGGTRGRKLFFDTSSGDVWVKRFAIENASQDERALMGDQIEMVLRENAR